MDYCLGTQLNFSNGKPSLLMPLDAKFSKDISPIVKSEKLTIEIIGAMIYDKMDRDLLRRPLDTNDLIISTSFKYRDSDPPVTKVHFLKPEVKVGEWVGTFDDNVIVTLQDFNHRDIKITVKIYDIDESNIDPEFVKVFFDCALLGALAFPELAPFAATGKFVSSMSENLINLIDKLDEHDSIINREIRLQIISPEQGIPVLQPGFIVCFSKEVDNSNLYLNRALRVLKNETQAFTDCSYAVLRVDREIIEDYKALEISQKAAKLAAELNGKGASGKAPLEFLQNTIDLYTRYRRLERFNELNQKNPGVDTPEGKLLEDLKIELAKDDVFKNCVKI